jgi:alanine racemase
VQTSPTVAVINLSGLSHNLSLIRHYLSQTTDILAVVKANAYGHGAVPICQALALGGIRHFGVATLEEGIALREAGISQDILVLCGLLSSQFPEVIAHRLTPIIFDIEVAEEFARWLPPNNAPYPVHIKVETGMNRLGVHPSQVLPLISSAPFQHLLKTEALMTHLSDADNSNHAYTDRQLKKFSAVLQKLGTAGCMPPIAHAANSAGILFHPQSHFNMVRPGLMLYGYQPSDSTPSAIPTPLRPILTLQTKVLQLRSVPAGSSVSYNGTHITPKESRIAVLPIGYADGFSRALSNRGTVLVKGCRAPIVGRVCMDMTMIDVTGIPNIHRGDDVILIGSQGTESITADEIASLTGTIAYEVLCGIGPRVPRIYRDLPTSHMP